MKRFVFCIIALLLCLNTTAKEKIVSYVIKYNNGYKSAYMRCQGNFDKGVLQDGPVTFSFGATLTGIYNHSQNPNFEGVARYDGYTLQCYGNIYNEKEHYSISAKSNKWCFDLKFEIEGSDKFWVDMENTASTNIMEKAIITDGFSDERGVDVSIYKRDDNAVDELYRYIQSLLFELRDDINATVLLKNGNKYCGPIYFVGDRKIKLGWKKNGSFDCEYWWANGDYFKGKASRQSKYSINARIKPLEKIREDGIIPQSGIMRYADGSIESLWKLDGMGEYFTIDTTPTELREKAKELQAQKEQELREKEAAELLARQEKEIEKVKEAQKKEERRQLLISKYGAKYGNELAKGNLQLGMTKEMCKEVVNYDAYDVILNSVMNKVVETWMFNKNKQMQQVAGVMSQMSPEEVALASLFLGMADNMGVMNPKYTVLTFTDDKLTSLY